MPNKYLWIKEFSRIFAHSAGGVCVPLRKGITARFNRLQQPFTSAVGSHVRRGRPNAPPWCTSVMEAAIDGI